MKFYFKTVFKQTILILLLSLSSTSCEKDFGTDSETSEIEKEEIVSLKAEWLGVDELPSKVIQAISGSSQSKIALNKQSSSFFKRITTDSVVRTIDSLDFKKYSFKSAVSFDTDKFYFENYIVALDPNDNIGTYTIRYSPDKEWFLENGTENLIHFTGNIGYYKDDGSLFWQADLINGKVNSSISNKSSNTSNKTGVSSKLNTEAYQYTVVISTEDCYCHTTHNAGGCAHPITVINIIGPGSPGITYYSGGGSGEGDPTDPGFGGGGSSTPVNSMTVKETYVWYINECLSTNQPLTVFLNTLSTSNLRDLKDFLQDNNCSDGAIDFGSLVLEAWDGDGIDDGEVDFENKVIKDSSFTDTKADCVYELLSSTNNNLFKDVLSTFTNGKAEFELKLRIGEVPDAAEGSTTFDSTTGIITITFPTNINTMSSLDIAAIILHEGIHAELRRIYHGNNMGSEPLPLTQYNYLLTLWEHYIGISPSSKVANNATHTFMVHNHVLPLANAIRELDNNSYSLDHYMWFGWDGLSDIGKITIPQLLTISQETNYINLKQISINDNIKQSCDD